MSRYGYGYCQSTFSSPVCKGKTCDLPLPLHFKGRLRATSLTIRHRYFVQGYGSTSLPRLAKRARDAKDRPCGPRVGRPLAIVHCAGHDTASAIRPPLVALCHRRDGLASLMTITRPSCAQTARGRPVRLVMCLLWWRSSGTKTVAAQAAPARQARDEDGEAGNHCTWSVQPFLGWLPRGFPTCLGRMRDVLNKHAPCQGASVNVEKRPRSASSHPPHGQEDAFGAKTVRVTWTVTAM